MWRQVMEAQFFIQLRKYLFAPAVLALKHAIDGKMFSFEKPLIVDSLLQVLGLLCPSNIKRNELCDCTPLLFCWLLEQCNASATESDFYQFVNLSDLKNDQKQYFNDPASVSNVKPGPLVIREKATILSNAIRHVDLRSLTRYMQAKTHYANISYCKCDEYLIYDLPFGSHVTTVAIDRLTTDQVKQLYATMGRKYSPFTLITRDALHAGINDQLVIMEDRMVAVLLSRKISQRPKTGGSDSARQTEYVFEIYNPLKHKAGKPSHVSVDEFYQANRNGSRDPSLPAHFSSNVCTISHIGEAHNNEQSAPIQQITVIALDISRSMFEKPASPGCSDSKTVSDMSIIMLGRLCDGNAFQNSALDVGLIHFGTSVDVVCPITRNRDTFEKALGTQIKPEEWTCMYDALSRAVSLIVNYEQINQKSVASDCQRLIICISDGIDNHSSITLKNLEERLKKFNVIVDFSSFLRDDLLKIDEEKTVRDFRALCKRTHGYIYRNLPRTNIELEAMFEQEAAVWVCERESTSFGFVDSPVHRLPAQLHEKATHQLQIPPGQSGQGVADSQRIFREVQQIMRTQSLNINVYVCRNCISFWKVILNGPSQTLYESGRWLLYVHFDAQYPRHPPKIRFVTEIYHVNISADGRVCHDILNRGWNSDAKMIDVLQSILKLLEEPNFNDAVSSEKAQLKRDDAREYDRQVKQHTQQHASKTVCELKREFELED